jgi:PREDICTED: similar to mitogen-activated protein kinase kinase kinase
MEYCPNGQLYDILKRHKVPPILVVEWSRQIASGMNYLHSKKIIHRDLKSLNVLMSSNNVLKISDFGNCRLWDDRSIKMSFAGTVAWMAPEVIRNENCSEKVDVWSFGVVMWEILTCEVPYKDVDSSAVIWGVGNTSLHLPVPSTCPQGFKLLLELCWTQKPSNRPSFAQICNHINIAAWEITSIDNLRYEELQASWKQDIERYFSKMKRESRQISHFSSDEEIDLGNGKDQVIRDHYEKKLEKVNNLFVEVQSILLKLEQRERQIKKKEQMLLGSKSFLAHNYSDANEFFVRQKLNACLQTQDVIFQRIDKILQLIDQEKLIKENSETLKSNLIEIKEAINLCRYSLESFDSSTK